MAGQSNAGTRPVALPLAGSLPATRLLAALVLADGRRVSDRHLAMAMLERDDRQAVRQVRYYGASLVATGVDGLCRVHGGYRLAALPPDDLLDMVLDAIDRIRATYPRSRWPSIDAWLDGSS